MRKVTKVTTSAFIARKAASCQNTHTDGEALFLHGNKIAEWRDGELWVTNAGWPSSTTKDRLNALPGVSLFQKNRVWHLNGRVWWGEWTKV